MRHSLHHVLAGAALLLLAACGPKWQESEADGFGGTTPERWDYPVARELVE